MRDHLAAFSIGFFVAGYIVISFRAMGPSTAIRSALSDDVEEITEDAVEARLSQFQADSGEGRLVDSWEDSPPEKVRDLFAPLFVYPRYGGGKAPYVKSEDIVSKAASMKRTFSQASQDMIIIKLFDMIDERQKGHPFPPNFAQGKRAILNDILSIVRMNADDAAMRKLPKRRFFIDLAANNAVNLSNTLLLEAAGWQGLCVEPNSIYWSGLARLRTCRVVGAVVGKDGAAVKMKMNAEMGGIEDPAASSPKNDSGDVQRSAKDESFNAGVSTVDKEGTSSVKYSVSMDTMFKRFKVPSVVDYLSLDVEGAEELVMKSFPFDKFTVLFLTIERPSEGLISLLIQEGYIPVAVLVGFGDTLWMHKSVPLTVQESRNVTNAIGWRVAKKPSPKMLRLWPAAKLFFGEMAKH